MANTYFEIEKINNHQGNGSFRSYTNKMCISLTAFVGGHQTLQLTVSTSSTIENQSGTGFITLTKEEAIALANAIMERVNGEISATGSEKSKFQL